MIKTKLMVFGGSGFLGKEILLSFFTGVMPPEEQVVSVSRSETRIIDAMLQLEEAYPHKNLLFKSADVTNAAQVRELIFIYRPEKVIIASAMKHIHLCESNVDHAVNVNVMGTRNIINAVDELNASLPENKRTKLVFVSTDKACEPIGTYGYTKSLAEKVVLKSGYNVVRYGNVLNSPMSIIPRLRSLPEGSTINLTHTDMTRFLMTAEQAVRLISAAMYCLPPGYIYVPELFAMKISDLMELYAEKKNLKINVTNSWVNEKLHEKMVGELENAYRTLETIGKVSKVSNLNSGVFRLGPPGHEEKNYPRKNFISSHHLITKEHLKDMLVELNLL